MVWVTIYEDGPTTTVDQTISSPGGSLSSATNFLVASSSASVAKEAGINEEVAMMNKVALARGVQNQAGGASSITSSSIIPHTSPASMLIPSSTSGSSSFSDLPTRPDGSASIPINKDHLSAPVAKDSVPAGAATYTPPTAGIFNNTDFAAWMKQQEANLASK